MTFYTYENNYKKINKKIHLVENVSDARFS